MFIRSVICSFVLGYSDLRCVLKEEKCDPILLDVVCKMYMKPFVQLEL